MLLRMLTILLSFSYALCKIEKQSYPTNGQTGDIRFFVKKERLCRFNVSEFNLRFKKCVIPMEYGKILPKLVTLYDKNDLGVKQLYELFCQKTQKKRLSLFDNGETKVDLGEKTETYPFSAFQRINCKNKNKQSEEEIELQKEMSKELGLTFSESSKTDLKKAEEEIIEVLFSLQPTTEEAIIEKKGYYQSENELVDQSLHERSDEELKSWVDNVVGGYYLEDALDFSNIQANSFVFVEGESEKELEPLSSIEARPVLWMVLFEWQNVNHLEKKADQHYEDLSRQFHSKSTIFELGTMSASKIWNNQNKKYKNKLEKRGFLMDHRFNIKTSKNHNNRNEKILDVEIFLKNLEKKNRRSQSFL